MKSSPERGAFGRHRAQALKEFLSRLALDLTDDEVLEIQIIENVVRSDVHPFEEAQGFRALLDREAGAYTIEKIAAKTGKAASYIAKRIKLLDLIPTAATAFTAKHIGIEHALLLAKLSARLPRESSGPLLRRLLCGERRGTQPRPRGTVAGVDRAQRLSEPQKRAVLEG